MMLVIENLLERSKLERIRSVLNDAYFTDGKATAGHHAKPVKNNLQAIGNSPDSIHALAECKTFIAQALVTNNTFQAWARPKAVIEILFVKYEAGHEYGWHVDNPMMNNHRTDLAFTLFMNSYQTYSGGLHEIDTSPDRGTIRGYDANSCMIYPANTRHRVTPIKSGSRLVAVGWIQSYVRDHAQRELIYDLERAASALFEKHGKTDDHDLIAKTAMNLERMWIE